MNLLLFSPEETTRPLPHADPRARHLLRVLRRQVGDTFAAGLIDGPRGHGTLVALDAAALTLTFTWGLPPPPPEPLTLIVGLPRPQTARDILRDATTLGVAALHFVATEKADPNYAHSTLWRGEWRRHLLAGAEQAGITRLPAVAHGAPLAATLAGLPSPVGRRLALDPYEAAGPLGAVPWDGVAPLVLALGPERGWGPRDRAELRARGYTLVHLGERILRTETAVVAALAVLQTARHRPPASSD